MLNLYSINYKSYVTLSRTERTFASANDDCTRLCESKTLKITKIDLNDEDLGHKYLKIYLLTFYSV